MGTSSGLWLSGSCMLAGCTEAGPGSLPIAISLMPHRVRSMVHHWERQCTAGPMARSGILRTAEF